MTPENAAQFEYHKMQLIGSLQTLANNMKECAAVAEQYAHIISGVPYMGNPNMFPPLANGQYPMPIMAPMTQDEPGKKRKSRGDDGEGKKKAKKFKDPNAPKRPPSSYLLFQNDVRNELKQQNPGMRNNELLGAISTLWGKMEQGKKDTYEARNKELKDQWRANKAAYESSKAGASALPVAASAPATPTVTKAAPVIAPVAAPVAEEDSSEEESADEDDDASSSRSSSEDGDPAPPLKKSKKETAAAAVKDEAATSKKEKKHKKTKA